MLEHQPCLMDGENSQVDFAEEGNFEGEEEDYFCYYSWKEDGTEQIRRLSLKTQPKMSDKKKNSNNNFTEVNIPSSTVKDQGKRIDESHTPKRLTTLTKDENIVRKFSGTHLAELQRTSESIDFEKGDCLNVINESATTTPIRLRESPMKESKVLVLYTGGTIGMKSSDGLSGVYSPQQHYLPRAIRELPPLNDKEYVDKYYSDVQVKPYCLSPVRGMKRRVVYWLVEYEPLLDSSDMTFDDWIRIARDIQKSYAAYDGFVVLHGTDTLAYTACALSFMLENLGKPVVVTGAQIPVAEVRSDGRENMIGALIVAGNMDIPEVSVLFNNKLLRGNRVTKLNNTGLEAFDSPNLTPLATMDISINVNYESIFRSYDVAPFHAHENLCRNVVVLRIFPSMPIESVQASLRPPTRGVVLQTFGSGNMPTRRTDILDEIRKAVQRGCLILNVSQCIKGHVDVNYATGKIVADAGVIPGSDMTTEAALTKLAYVLSKDEWDETTKKMMLQRNIRGELTENRLLRNALFPPLVCHAAYENNTKLLENLRLSGANVAGVDYNSRTALHVAAASGSVEAVEYLLAHGVSVHARDSVDDNALMCAIRSKNLDVIRAIKNCGGQLSVPLPRIGVELCLAAGASDLRSLMAWQEANADLSTGDYDGRTALHVASGQGLDTVVEFLCDHGARAKIKDHFGRTPLEECLLAMDALEKNPEAKGDKHLKELTSRLERTSEILVRKIEAER
ncbi:ankyrin repeats (3 copies) domain-containing protein [Ditylenchus destructor]|nr:ankyrin repeats (3 copies) domain-containing protein [Ditylenchus destructor]